MSTNTLKHISDKSEFKTFDPTGSNFDADVTNVQQALSQISRVGITGVLPDATEDVKGIIRISTEQEVLDGNDRFSAVTPATLKARLAIPTQATETYVGITRYATNAEAIAGTVTDAAIVASSLKATIDNVFTVRTANENANGVLKISTTPAALAGTDDTTAMSPLKVSQAIGAATAALPVYSTATQTTEGLVRIASGPEVAAGTLHNGVAISPLGLASLTSTQGQRGIIRLATPEEASAGNDSSIALSPSTLLSRTGTTGRVGVVRLTTEVGNGDGNTALAFNANVLSTNGGTIHGALQVNGGLNANNYLRRNGVDVVTHDQLPDNVPVGTIMMWGGYAGGVPAKWRACVGGNYQGQAYLNAVGAKWGNWGDIPDFRGLFPRGANQTDDWGQRDWEVNGHIAAARGTDGYGKPRLGEGVGSFGTGSVQAQMLRYHKHAGGFGEHDNYGAFGNSASSNFVGTRKGIDWDNRSYFTNEGFELPGGRDAHTTLNAEGLVGNETRPWSMSILFIIKVE
jgi:hypothetical protein